MFQNDLSVVGKVEFAGVKAVEADKTAKAYTAPKLVLIGQSVELVQGGNYGCAYDYNYGLSYFGC